ncbi:periplasmic binding protein-like I [Paraphysoderma sedebokerense]|nr:periplasmic binding protein-like I [Paraphysoderma sedebokerense]
MQANSIIFIYLILLLCYSNVILSQRTTVKIGLLLPLSQNDSAQVRTLIDSSVGAVRYAVDEINNSPLLPNIQIQLIELDSMAPSTNNTPVGIPPIPATGRTVNNGQAIVSTINLINQNVSAIIGDLLSKQTILEALISSKFMVPQCSFSSAAGELSDKNQYPFFFRTVASVATFGEAAVNLVKYFNWTKVAILNSVDSFGTGLANTISERTKDTNVSVLVQQSFWDRGEQSDLSTPLKNIKDSNARVIILAAVAAPQMSIMRQALRLNMLGNPDYTWITVNNITDDAQKFLGDEADKLRGVFMIDAATKLPGLPEYDAWVNKWSVANPALYPTAGPGGPKQNEILAYSCVYSIARAWARLIQNSNNQAATIADLAGGKYTTDPTPKFFNTGYNSPAGPLQFDEHGDIQGNWEVYNWKNGVAASYARVLAGRVTVFSKPVFSDGTSNIPLDGPRSRDITVGMNSLPGKIFFALTCGLMLFDLMILGTIIYFRENKLIKALSPLFCVLILIGALFIYLGVILHLLRGLERHIICYLDPVAFVVGLTMVVGNIIVKNQRIYQIFGSPLAFRNGLPDEPLLKLSIGFVAVAVILVLPYLFAQNCAPAVVQASPTTHYVTCLTSIRAVQNGWLWAIIVYEFALISYAIFLAWKTRKVPSGVYKEAKSISICVYNIFFGLLLTFPTLFIGSYDYLTPFYLRIIATLFCTTFTICAFFLPHLYTLFFSPNSGKDLEDQITSAILGSGGNLQFMSGSDHNSLSSPTTPTHVPQTRSRSDSNQSDASLASASSLLHAYPRSPLSPSASRKQQHRYTTLPSALPLTDTVEGVLIMKKSRKGIIGNISSIWDRWVLVKVVVVRSKQYFTVNEIPRTYIKSDTGSGRFKFDPSKSSGVLRSFRFVGSPEVIDTPFTPTASNDTKVHPFFFVVNSDRYTFTFQAENQEQLNHWMAVFANESEPWENVRLDISMRLPDIKEMDALEKIAWDGSQDSPRSRGRRPSNRRLSSGSNDTNPASLDGSYKYF